MEMLKAAYLDGVPPEREWHFPPDRYTPELQADLRKAVQDVLTRAGLLHLVAGMTLQTALRTKRLLLRPFEVGDVADAQSYRDDKEFARFLPHIPQPFTRNDAEAFVALNISEPWDRSPTFAVVAADLVFQSPDGEVFVIKVEPQFLETAANLRTGDVAKVAATWAKNESSGGFSKSELAELVEQVRAFAAQALKAKKPVLQLSSI